MWGEWGEWSKCQGRCGGSQTRVRLCDPPRNGGLDCEGEHIEERDCPQCQGRTLTLTTTTEYLVKRILGGDGSRKNVPWTQGCAENVRESPKICGTRQPTFASGLVHGQTLPGEFPWTCLLLKQNNDFVGSCAVIPDDFSNDNGRPTRKVITAAHKLKNIQRNE